MSECPARFSLISHRFVGLVIAVFLLQVALIYWLSDRSPLKPKAPMPQPVIALVNADPDNLLGLEDPSIFGLPHNEGFSGSAWMLGTPPPNSPFDWTEEPRWLPVQFGPLHLLSAMFATNTAPMNRLVIGRIPPDVATPGLLKSEMLPGKSRLAILSINASTDWSPAIPLPSWPHVDIVSNSIVQVVIRSDGSVLSAALIESGGHAPADEFALNTARHLRFDPADNPLLRSTQLAFEWHTIPVPQEKVP